MQKDDSNKSKKLRLTVSSLQEQEQRQYAYWASLTPEERLQEFFAMMNKLYKLSLNGRPKMRLVIDR